MEYTESPSHLVIERIDLDQVPFEAMERFETYSQRFIHQEEYVPKNFIGFWKIGLIGGTCYIAEQKKIQNQAHGVYIYQYDTKGSPLGYAEIGEIETNNNPYTWLYYIGAIQPRSKFATNILPFLGSLSEYFFHKPLNSTRSFVSQGKNPSGEDIRPIKTLLERLKSEGTVRMEDGVFIFVKDRLAKILEKNS